MDRKKLSAAFSAAVSNTANKRVCRKTAFYGGLAANAQPFWAEMDVFANAFAKNRPPRPFQMQTRGKVERPVRYALRYSEGVMPVWVLKNL